MPVPFEVLQKRLEEYANSRNDVKSSSKRLLILRVLYESRIHMSPDELYRKVREEFESNIGVSTIYRTLSFFEEAGIVKQVNIDAHTKRYEINTGKHHDHLICQRCGEIIEFYNESLEKLQEAIAQEHGYVLSDHEMQLYGICPKCQKS